MHIMELQYKYSCPAFFTDASKTYAGVSHAAVGPSFSDAGTLNPETSIFTAEAYAILTAVKHIKALSITRAIIYTDSLSIVKALKTLKKHRNPVIMSLYSAFSAAYASKI